MDSENKNVLTNTQPPIGYQPRPLFQLSKKDTVFALFAVIVSVFSAIFGIFGGFAVGYSASILLFQILFVSYFFKGNKNALFAFGYGILSLLHGAVFVCTTNSSVRFFSVIISFLLSLLCFHTLVNGRVKTNRKTLGTVFSAASTIENVDIALKSLFSTADGNRKTLGKVLVGLLCAVPVLVVVVPLLISSDEAFRGMMKSIFSNTFSTILKTVFGIALSVLVMTYGISMKADRTTKLKEYQFAGIENVYIISFLSTVSVSYLLYLFSQLAYFFSAFRGFLPNGQITYAQYARKGFFEMSVVAVINLAVVFLSLILAKKENGKVCCGVKILLTFISLFTLIIISTAISKMLLYIDTYGMTVLRLTTSAFMVFLAVVFLSAVLRIYFAKINVVKTALITASCVILLLGTINVNAVCAKYNYEAYKTQKLKTIDVEALYDLGDEGIPYLVDLCGSKDNEIALKAQRMVAKAYRYYYFDNMQNRDNFTTEDLEKNQKGKGFSYFSIPRQRAYAELYRFIDENPGFSSVCKDLCIGSRERPYSLS